MARLTQRNDGRWAGVCVLLLLLALAGCAGPAQSAQDPSPTAAHTSTSTSRPAQAAATLPALETATPTREIVAPVPSATRIPPTATVTPLPTPTHTPSATPTATATPTPTLRRLTSDGCCTQPFWSPDSGSVLFIDRPPADPRLGIWGVDINGAANGPELRTERIAFYTSDLSYAIEYGGNQTVIERLDAPLGETSERWTVPAGGRSISLSPGHTRIAWQVSNENVPSERSVTELWVANLDGSEARSVATLPRGGLVGWLSEDVLVLSGRESVESRDTVVYSFSLLDGTKVELIHAERPRGYALSADRRWLAYYITFSDNRSENGLWVVRTDGSERRQLDRELFGDYAWRDARHLLLIPMRPDATFHELWEYDAETAEVRRLTDPTITPFKIANGDWDVSPDGRLVAFVSSSDHNIWLLTLVD